MVLIDVCSVAVFQSSLGARHSKAESIKLQPATHIGQKIIISWSYSVFSDLVLRLHSSALTERDGHGEKLRSVDKMCNAARQVVTLETVKSLRHTLTTVV